MVEHATIAALVTAVLLVGGVALAAGMGAFSGGAHGGPWGHGHGEADRGHGPMGGPMMGGMHGDHMPGAMPGHEGECGCGFITGGEWVNATIVGVDAEDRIVTLNISGSIIEAHVAMKYYENETGYLVYGPWLLSVLEPGMHVKVLVPADDDGLGDMDKLVGISFDGRTLLMPGHAMHGGHSES